MQKKTLTLISVQILASRGTPVHRNNSPYGENIFCSWSSIPNMVVKGWEPVEHWYSENVNHQYGKEPSTLKTGHFTQVVRQDFQFYGKTDKIFFNFSNFLPIFND